MINRTANDDTEIRGETGDIEIALPQIPIKELVVGLIVHDAQKVGISGLSLTLEAAK